MATQEPRDGTTGATDAEGGLMDALAALGQVGEETLRSLADGLEGAEDAVREGLGKAEETIREHPLLAVGVAAGLGFLLGVLLRGRGEPEQQEVDSAGAGGEVVQP